MNINSNTMISITEANRNFSKVTKLVDKEGSAVLMKNNTPRYLILDLDKINQAETLADVDVMTLSDKLLEKNFDLYKVLADE